MTIHARSGGSIEVMGLMTGYILPHTIIVTDAFPLPVEGTETRVNAQEEAYAYMVSYLELSRSAGRLENCVGWYHSHPGYGCWLSGIDVRTEQLQQGLNEPFCAVVIDPERTASSGKVEIGAFRTYKTGNAQGTVIGGGGGENNEQRQKKRRAFATDSTAATATSLSSGASRQHSHHNQPQQQQQQQQKQDSRKNIEDASSSIPLGKLQDYGYHADEYYALEVSHYKSTLDSALLSQLNNRYWGNTLASASSEANKEYATRQIQDFTAKIEAAGIHEKPISRSRGENRGGIGGNGDSGAAAGIAIGGGGSGNGHGGASIDAAAATNAVSNTVGNGGNGNIMHWMPFNTDSPRANTAVAASGTAAGAGSAATPIAEDRSRNKEGNDETSIELRGFAKEAGRIAMEERGVAIAEEVRDMIFGGR